MSQQKELTTALYELVERSKDPKRLARAVAAYLLETRQTKQLGGILRDLESMRLRKDGVLEVHVTAARPLGATTKQAIAALFDAKQTIIHEEQDLTLLGGVKVRAHDKELDYSVRTRLQRLRQGA